MAVDKPEKVVNWDMHTTSSANLHRIWLESCYLNKYIGKFSTGVQNKSLLKYLWSKNNLLVTLIGKTPFLKEEEEWWVFLFNIIIFRDF